MLRTFFKADLGQVLTIENAVHIAPWTEDTFKACLQAGYPAWVAEVDKKVIGFIMISIHEECHVLNICIAREYQHQGWGQRLLAHALSYAKDKGVAMAYLEVRRSNSRAIALYKKMNFRLVGERKAYYPGPTDNEDALVFAKSLVVTSF